MFAIGGERCPVGIFLEYMNRRPVSLRNTGPFYLAINHNRRKDDDVWFKAQPMGVNKINTMMKSIVAGTSLEESSKKFTNHSARKTLVKKLKKDKVERSSIAKVTGHRNIQSLDDYDEGDEDEQKQLSLAISRRNNQPNRLSNSLAQVKNTETTSHTQSVQQFAALQSSQQLNRPCSSLQPSTSYSNQPQMSHTAQGFQFGLSFPTLLSNQSQKQMVVNHNTFHNYQDGVESSKEISRNYIRMSSRKGRLNGQVANSMNYDGIVGMVGMVGMAMMVMVMIMMVTVVAMMMMMMMVTVVVMMVVVMVAAMVVVMVIIIIIQHAAPTWIKNELKEGIRETIDDDADSEDESDSDDGTDSEVEDTDNNKNFKSSLNNGSSNQNKVASASKVITRTVSETMIVGGVAIAMPNKTELPISVQSSTTSLKQKTSSDDKPTSSKERAPFSNGYSPNQIHTLQQDILRHKKTCGKVEVQSSRESSEAWQSGKLQDNYNVVIALQEQLARLQQRQNTTVSKNSKVKSAVCSTM
ncbi:hypothetical protein QZH41_007411 [Actinostola sp. cb2023]|nr:hypothetical protein QZH41_007411 [Actinostola sp. cb2023]